MSILYLCSMTVITVQVKQAQNPRFNLNPTSSHLLQILLSTRNAIA
jgi:hypothetical protein